MWPLLLLALLAGCGGGGGGGEQVIQPIVAAVQRPDLLFAYFGVMGEQIKETAAHVTANFVCAFGEPWWTPQGRPSLADKLIAQMEEGRAAGVTKIILDVGFLIFDPHYRYEGVAALKPFVERLKAAGLWDRVVALYPIDEPDLHGKGDGEMNAINTELRQFGKPLACIYQDKRQWPGLSTVDWAGFDKYGVDVHGDGVLADLKGRLRPEQRLLLVVGGCDPWKDEPEPVLAYANGDAQVVGIVAFIWGSNYGGTTHQGIRDNGMAPRYAAVGAAIKGYPATTP